MYWARFAAAAAVISVLSAQTPRVPTHISGKLADMAITESSGVAASRQNPGIFWTHNDSDNPPDLFAFDRTGRSYGRWTVPSARNVDWEDIDIGPAPGGGWDLYIGDIGDNSRARKEVVIYRLKEPKVGTPEQCRGGCRTAPPETFRLEYPDGPHNAEALLVHPQTGDLYIITKAWHDDRDTGVYVVRAPELRSGPVKLQRLGTLEVPDKLTRALLGGITGGAISPDGRHIALCDYLYVYEATLPAGAPFDSIWKQPFAMRATGTRVQTEGIAYTPDGRILILTAEGKGSEIVEIRVADLRAVIDR